MRRVIFLLSLLFAVYGAAAPRYSVTLGMSKPFAPEELQRYWRSGFNLAAGIGVKLKPQLELQGELLYNRLELDDTAFLGNITSATDVYSSVSGGATSITELSARLKYFSQSIKSTTPYLYLSLGGGLKVIAEKEVTTADRNYKEPRDSVFSPSTGIGLGAEVKMAKNSLLVVEGGFQLLWTDPTTVYLPLKIGVIVF
ncbi:MAG: hypothetical protein ONB24_07940 [candidate division KSB1 bacterium]|nr:hypothetical protein [candidate division KSB1 bacterium]